MVEYISGTVSTIKSRNDNCSTYLSLKSIGTSNVLKSFLKSLYLSCSFPSKRIYLMDLLKQPCIINVVFRTSISNVAPDIF